MLSDICNIKCKQRITIVYIGWLNFCSKYFVPSRLIPISFNSTPESSYIRGLNCWETSQGIVCRYLLIIQFLQTIPDQRLLYLLVYSYHLISLSFSRYIINIINHVHPYLKMTKPTAEGKRLMMLN